MSSFPRYLHSKTRYLTQPRDSHGRWRTMGRALGSKTRAFANSARGKGFFPVASVERTGIAISGASAGVGYGRKISPNFRGSVTLQFKVQRTKQSKTQKRLNKAFDKRLKNIKNPRAREFATGLVRGGTIPVLEGTGLSFGDRTPAKQSIKLSSGRNFAQEARHSTPKKSKDGSKGVPSTISGAKGAAKRKRPQRRGAKQRTQRIAYSGQRQKAARAPSYTIGSHDMNSRRSVNTPTIKQMKQPTTRLKKKSAGTYTK